MELYKEILIKVLEKQEAVVMFPELKIDVEKIVEMECYKALEKIKAIIADEKLSDRECFEKIEEIVCLFKEFGSDGGGRHDFG